MSGPVSTWMGDRLGIRDAVGMELFYFCQSNCIEVQTRWVILHGLQYILLELVENGRNVFFTGYCLLDVLQPLCC